MCGRQPGGKNTAEFGVCPAAADLSFDGINSGRCGGRICWAVAGTFCGGCVQGSFAEKRFSCLNCDFYQMVQEEEGFPEDNPKALLDMHLTLDIPDPGHMVDDIPEELRRFILKSGRRDPSRRYQDMERAMAVLKPLVDENRLSRRGSAIENKQCASLFLTYSAEKQAALKRLVNMFKINARELGVDVEVSENRDL